VAGRGAAAAGGVRPGDREGLGARDAGAGAEGGAEAPGEVSRICRFTWHKADVRIVSAPGELWMALAAECE
jgi:hypothetical protein